MNRDIRILDNEEEQKAEKLEQNEITKVILAAETVGSVSRSLLRAFLCFSGAENFEPRNRKEELVP